MAREIRGRQLDRLASYVGTRRCSQVLDVTWDEATRTFELREACDGYYREIFTPDELIELGTELICAATEVLL